jgi:hypothetical protein
MSCPWSVFIYVNFMLSKLNFVEQRVWLAVVGILSVAMGRSYVQQQVWLAVVGILSVAMGR